MKEQEAKILNYVASLKDQLIRLERHQLKLSVEKQLLVKRKIEYLAQILGIIKWQIGQYKEIGKYEVLLITRVPSVKVIKDTLLMAIQQMSAFFYYNSRCI